MRDECIISLARRLRGVKIDSPLLEENEPQETLCNVRMMPDGQTFGVRMYLAGAIRLLGYTKYEMTARRFADMCLRRLWKYRVRSAPEPDDNAYNYYSPEQAKADEKNHPEAVLILDALEEHISKLCEARRPQGVGEQLAALREEVAALRKRMNDLDRFLVEAGLREPEA